MHPDRYYISISGIWSRACGIYVLWICKEHSVRDRGGRHDRWLYTDPDLLPGRIPNHETDGYHGCNLTGNVDRNDYLLPYLVLDLKKYKTIPIVIQYLKGGYGAVDWGTMMAMLVLAIIPIIIFYGICQKYIIEGVVAGAVKG